MMDAEAMAFLAALAGAGVVAGFIGGLFGVGGGVIIVPALFHVFGLLGVSDDLRTHAAVATSLSTIVATSWRSLSAHAAAGAVEANVLKDWMPGVAIGAALGAVAAGFLSGSGLLLVFGGGILLVAANMGFGRDDFRLASDLPKGVARGVLSGGIGFLSALMGIGGGAFGVMLMTLCGRPIHRAVATASGFGMAIALPAALVYVIMGWGLPGLPWGSAGYVNLPGFAILAGLTTLTAPIGARLAHRLDRRRLRRLFAALLGVVGLNLLLEGLA